MGVKRGGLKFTSAEEISEVTAKALLYITRRPGISYERLAVTLGYSPLRPVNNHKKRLDNLAVPVVRALENLLKDGLIWLENPSGSASVGRASVFYPDGYEKPTPKAKKLDAIAAKTAQSCKTFTVPLNELHKYIPKKPNAYSRNQTSA